MGNPHVLAIPFPAQGHVIALMELSLSLAEKGFKVTFINTEFYQTRVLDNLTEKDDVNDLIRFFSIPDGLEPWEDRNDLKKFCDAIIHIMPTNFKELIEKINRSDNDEITCVVADQSLGWALEIAKNMGIKRVAYSPISAASLQLTFSIPRLIDEGIIDHNGTPISTEMIKLSPTMPAINPKDFLWACFSDINLQKVVLEMMINNHKFVKLAEFILCNSCYDIEPGAFNFFPEILPIGPLLASNRLGNSQGNFWKEDSTCLQWLDQQLTRSVVYVAFGSFTILDQIQFHELALGLELCNRPFLWVVRPDITDDPTNAYPKGFLDSVANRGRTVGWAPQQKVLSHPSIACFLSHCGWNSTMEGLSNGVPFLCWPYFADQFLNMAYVCDVWKTGMGFDLDENGIVTRGEIKKKLDKLLGDENFIERALELKKMAINGLKEGGSSYKNFNDFIEWLKQ